MFFRKLYYKIFKKYKTLELLCVSYSDGDKLIRQSEGKPENQRWVLAKEEDRNINYGMVYLARKERIRK